MGSAKGSSGSRSKRSGMLSHRGLIAIEAMLLLGVVKDWIFERLVKSTFPNYTKVLLVMAVTVGLFGGLFLVVEKLTASSVVRTHQAAKRLPVAVPTLAIHGALLFVLFILYARMLHLAVFS